MPPREAHRRAVSSDVSMTMPPGNAASPWHAGERTVHDRVDERALADRIHISADVPAVAAEFLAQQTIVYVSALVGTDVWVTSLTGEPGFAHVTGPREITVTAQRPRATPWPAH